MVEYQHNVWFYSKVSEQIGIASFYFHERLSTNKIKIYSMRNFLNFGGIWRFGYLRFHTFRAAPTSSE